MVNQELEITYESKMYDVINEVEKDFPPIAKFHSLSHGHVDKFKNEFVKHYGEHVGDYTVVTVFYPISKSVLVFNTQGLNNRLMYEVATIGWVEPRLLEEFVPRIDYAWENRWSSIKILTNGNDLFFHLQDGNEFLVAITAKQFANIFKGISPFTYKNHDFMYENELIGVPEFFERLQEANAL